MTIRKGVEWGEPVDRPDELLELGSDADLARVVADEPDRAVAVTAGDLHRSLGGAGARPTVQRVPMDVLELQIDGHEHTAVAHVVARRSWWRGPIVAVMNVDQLGAWNVAPRAHPNDGRFDVVEVGAAMSVRARWQARSRLGQGTHVPHPDIAATTATERRWVFDRPMRVWIDGAGPLTCTDLAVAIRPDAYHLHI